MGKITTERVFEKDDRIVEYFKENFNIKYEKDKNYYENVYIKDLLVNLNINNIDNYIIVKISKLVSLKAFLLSIEENIDVNKLIQKIDTLFNITQEGIETKNNGIVYDHNLERFLEIVNMKLEDNIINDEKRKARIEIIDRIIDFNTLKEIKEN